MSQWITQLRKGIIEYAILLLLDAEENYALNLVRRLNEYPSLQVSESTVYPILSQIEEGSQVVPTSGLFQRGASPKISLVIGKGP